MNHFYEIAALYFKRFEGAEFFPGWTDRRTISFLVSLLLFGFVLYWYFVANNLPFFSMWPTLAAEIVVIVCAHRIINYRRRSLIASLPGNSNIDENQRVNQAKRDALIELTGRPASEFLQQLDDIKKLQAIEQEHRSRLDPDVWKEWRAFASTPLWPRILSFLLVAAGVLFGKPEKILEINYSEFFKSPHSISLIASSLAILIGLVIFGFLLYILTRQLIELIALLLSTKWPNPQGNATVLEYMKRDLIKYYTPESKPKPATEVKTDEAQQPTPEPASKIEPASLGVAIAILGIKALYTAWLNSKPPLKK